MRLAIREGTFRRTSPSCRFLPPPNHDVVALPELGDERGDIRRVILEIRVQRHDHVTSAVLEASAHRRGLSEVPPEANHPYMLVSLSELHEHFKGAIHAAVVHVDHLPAEPHGSDMAGDLGVQLRQVLLLVKDRDDQRQLDGGGGDAALVVLGRAVCGVSVRHWTAIVSLMSRSRGPQEASSAPGQVRL